MSGGFCDIRSIRRYVLLIVGPSCMFQLGGCIGSWIPAALAFGEQVLFSSILNDVLSL